MTEAQLGAMTESLGWAREDRSRYKGVFQPLQDKFIQKANNWDSAGSQAAAAAEAQADVTNSAALQEQQRARQMASMGINPTGGRYAGVERAVDVETALAGAGAQNNSRKRLRNEAMALQGEAINMGNGLPGQAGSSLGTGVNAGSSAASSAIGASDNFRANLGIMKSGFEGAGSMFNSAGNMFGNINQNRMNYLNQQDQMQQQGWGSIMGGVGSLAGLFLSDEDAKEDKREVRGVLDALRSMPVEAWKYKDGMGDGKEHVGPYAQDFKKATGLGDGKSISVVDALGVTMGAVKELAEKIDGMKSGRRPRAKSIMRMVA